MKLENVLVVRTSLHEELSSAICKLTDFGLAVHKQSVSLHAENVGTFPWMAPELFDAKQPSPASDMYSFRISVTWLIGTEML